MKWWLTGSLGVMTGLYCVALAYLYISQRHLIYQAPPGAATIPAGLDRITLKTSDGLDLMAAYRRGHDGQPTLIFFHGNGDSLEGADVATRTLRKDGFGILLVEYRGYGGNPGAPTEAGLYRDGRAALDWLAARGVDAREVVLVGNSLGSGVASQMATERPVRSLVLVSPFTSLSDVVASKFPYFPVRLLLKDRFESRTKLSTSQIPVLILHGEADSLIPVSESIALAKALPRSRLVLAPGIGHELAYLPSTQRMIANWLIHPHR